MGIAVFYVLPMVCTWGLVIALFMRTDAKIKRAKGYEPIWKAPTWFLVFAAGFSVFPIINIIIMGLSGWFLASDDWYD